MSRFFCGFQGGAGQELRLPAVVFLAAAATVNGGID
jgi:hypothetical protein